MAAKYYFLKHPYAEETWYIKVTSLSVSGGFCISTNTSCTDKPATMATTYTNRSCWCPRANILAYLGDTGKHAITLPRGVILVTGDFFRSFIRTDLIGSVSAPSDINNLSAA